MVLPQTAGQILVAAKGLHWGNEEFNSEIRNPSIRHFFIKR
jgi:hypothetical protein